MGAAPSPQSPNSRPQSPNLSRALEATTAKLCMEREGPDTVSNFVGCWDLGSASLHLWLHGLHCIYLWLQLPTTVRGRSPELRHHDLLFRTHRFGWPTPRLSAPGYISDCLGTVGHGAQVVLLKAVQFESSRAQVRFASTG